MFSPSLKPAASLAAVGLCLLCLSGDGAAQPERRRPGLLFGGGLIESRTIAVEIDDALPTGSLRLTRPRPALTGITCDVEVPVCVHGGRDAEQRIVVLQTLAAAFRDLVWGLQLPAPRNDLAQGGGPELDLYLDDATQDLQIYADGNAYLAEVSSAYCVVAGDVTPGRAARCVGEAIAFGLDAAETPALRRAYAAYLALLTQGPSTPFIDQVDAAQANPHLTLLRRKPSPTDQAGALFFAYIEQQLGLRQPGQLSTALLQLSRSKEPKRGLRYNNEPDLMDVLRRAVSDNPSDMADLMQGFAISRAFLGSRDDGTHVPGYRFLGDAGRVTIDWSIKLSSLPRNVAGTRVVEPMGSVYLWLELDAAPSPATPLEDLRLGLRASWERPVAFKWAAIAIDAEGRELHRWELPYLEKSTHVEKSLHGFGKAAGILFVGINLGGVDLAHPFDPDYEPWEPHAYSFYLAELPQE